MIIDTQLTSPSEPVCPGNPVIFTCQQSLSGGNTRWDIKSRHQNVQSTQVGSITFEVDGFQFEVRVVSTSSNILTSELQVTAVRELNDVTVKCVGATGNFMSTIQVASIGKYTVAMLIVAWVRIISLA